MELKEYKRKMNMPKYTNGLTKFNANTADWGGAVTNGISAVGAGIAAYQDPKTVSDLQAEAGTSVGSGTGFQYSKLNNVDESAQMSELSAQNTNNTLAAAGSGAALGGSIGMAFGPVGAGIGAVAGGLIGGVVGLFGGSSRKRRLRRRIIEAQDRIRRTNNYNLASAQSDYLQNQYNLEYGDTQNQQLYSANKGKDLVRPKIIKR